MSNDGFVLRQESSASTLSSLDKGATALSQSSQLMNNASACVEVYERNLQECSTEA